MTLPSYRIYLDHNGSTPVTPGVARELSAFIEGFWGNAGAAHPDGQAARSAIENARTRVAAAIGGHESEVTFTSGGTESNNAAIFGAAYAADGRKHIVAGRHEHLSVIRCVEALEGRGFDVTWVNPTSSGAVDSAEMSAAVRDDTALVALMLANNETGILQPVAKVGETARAHGALFFVDAVCGVGKIPVDVGAIGCDVLSLSGHKLHAPKGIGALWTRSGVSLDPFVLGCGQQAGRRSGTENTMGAVALGAAIEQYGTPSEAQQSEQRAGRDRLFAGLQALDIGVERNGHGADLPNTLSVWLPGQRSDELQQALGRAGLSVTSQTSRAPVTDALPGDGALMPSHVLLSMGADDARASQSLRFSLGLTTRAQEVERALEVLASVLTPSPTSSRPLLGSQPS